MRGRGRWGRGRKGRDRQQACGGIFFVLAKNSVASLMPGTTRCRRGDPTPRQGCRVLRCWAADFRDGSYQSRSRTRDLQGGCAVAEICGTTSAPPFPAEPGSAMHGGAVLRPPGLRPHARDNVHRERTFTAHSRFLAQGIFAAGSATRSQAGTSACAVARASDGKSQPETTPNRPGTRESGPGGQQGGFRARGFGLRVTFSGAVGRVAFHLVRGSDAAVVSII
jgi:hypothetical protein